MCLTGAARSAARRTEQRSVFAKEERHAVEPGADPDELAGRAQLVELLGPVVPDTAGQHFGLPQPDGKRQSLQGHQRFAQRSAAVDPVPAGQEAPERRLLGRLDLAPQRGERGATEPPQHVGVAPLALGAAGTELAADELVRPLELLQDRLDVEAEPRARLRGRERPAPARVALDERDERVGAGSRNASGRPDGGITPSASR